MGLGGSTRRRLSVALIALFTLPVLAGFRDGDAPYSIQKTTSCLNRLRVGVTTWSKPPPKVPPAFGYVGTLEFTFVFDPSPNGATPTGDIYFTRTRATAQRTYTSFRSYLVRTYKGTTIPGLLLLRNNVVIYWWAKPANKREQPSIDRCLAASS